MQLNMNIENKVESWGSGEFQTSIINDLPLALEVNHKPYTLLKTHELKTYTENRLIPKKERSTSINYTQDQEINPGASLKNIIPVLNGVTPKYLSDTCPELDTVAQFSFIGGMGEYIKQIMSTVHNRK